MPLMSWRLCKEISYLNLDHLFFMHTRKKKWSFRLALCGFWTGNQPWINLILCLSQFFFQVFAKKKQPNFGNQWMYQLERLKLERFTAWTLDCLTALEFLTACTLDHLNTWPLEVWPSRSFTAWPLERLKLHRFNTWPLEAWPSRSFTAWTLDLLNAWILERLNAWTFKRFKAWTLDWLERLFKNWSNFEMFFQ